jgi:hypothetical protein
MLACVVLVARLAGAGEPIGAVQTSSINVVFTGSITEIRYCRGVDGEVDTLFLNLTVTLENKGNKPVVFPKGPAVVVRTVIAHAGEATQTGTTLSDAEPHR